MADDLDAIRLDDFARHCAFDVAAALDCKIDQHGTRPHGCDHVLAHEARRGSAGNERGGDYDVLLLDVIGDERRAS